jgi:Spy/CpxP family protein refolding chaperone
MKRLILLGAMVLSLAVPMVWAQEQAGGEGGRRGQRGMRGLPDVQQAVTLTAEQKEKVAALREKFAEELGALPRDREAFQKMRDLRQEMSEAAKAGDDAKVEKLRKEINETDMMAQRRKIVSKYYDDVEKVLTAKQKKQFGEYRKLLESDVPAGLVANPDELKAAVKKVELSEAQKKKVDEAFARYEKHGASLPADEAQLKQAKQIELAGEVVGALKPSQKLLLSEAARSGRPRGGGA